MPQYRQRPEIVDAVEYTGPVRYQSVPHDWQETWNIDLATESDGWVYPYLNKERVVPGDWIITFRNGFKECCRGPMFDILYEKVPAEKIVPRDPSKMSAIGYAEYWASIHPDIDIATASQEFANKIKAELPFNQSGTACIGNISESKTLQKLRLDNPDFTHREKIVNIDGLDILLGTRKDGEMLQDYRAEYF